MENVLVDFNTLPWQSPAAGVRFKVVKKAGKQLRLVEFSKEFEEKDWCGRGHIGYVLQGEMALNFSGHIKYYQSGQGLFIPGGQKYKHKLIVLKECTRLILVEEAEN
ncbi:MAG: hypothetical protein ACE5HS_19935 [bacterium]